MVFWKFGVSYAATFLHSERLYFLYDRLHLKENHLYSKTMQVLGQRWSPYKIIIINIMAFWLLSLHANK
jgi:hypothetical protein